MRKLRCNWQSLVSQNLKISGYKSATSHKRKTLSTKRQHLSNIHQWETVRRNKCSTSPPMRNPIGSTLPQSTNKKLYLGINAVQAHQWKTLSRNKYSTSPPMKIPLWKYATPNPPMRNFTQEWMQYKPSNEKPPCKVSDPNPPMRNSHWKYATPNPPMRDSGPESETQ